MTDAPRWREMVAGERAPTLRLAAPIVLGHLGMMLMGIVDTLMVGSLGATAVGAVGVGSSVLGIGFMMGIGLLLGIDRQVAVSHGARRPDDVARAHAHGVLLALVASVPIVAGVLVASRYLQVLGVVPALVPQAEAWTRIAAWSLVPAMLFTAVRQSLQALGDTRAATVIMLVANGVNLFFNAALVHGRFGFDAMGAVGSAWATMIARGFTAVALVVWSLYRGPDLRVLEGRIHVATLRELLRLGGPASVQLVFEGGVFSLSTMLCARLGPVSAAAHQVVLQVASFTFMVPLGLSAAGAVRVGNAIGRGDPRGAARAGWSAVSLAAAVMVLSSVWLTVGGEVIVACFSLDAVTAALAQRLLLVAALFQLFDGCQVALSGVLRGSGDTVASMVANLVGHWFIGLPVGVALGFGLAWGAAGIWVGLAVGLGAVALALLAIWIRRMARIVRQMPSRMSQS